MKTHKVISANINTHNQYKISHQPLHLAKDPWVVCGMMDYYSNTNSVRIVDVLVKVQTPHDNYIFDKLNDWVNSAKRNQAFSLFWHIVKKHPSWLHKVATHALFREILRVLKVCGMLQEFQIKILFINVLFLLS